MLRLILGVVFLYASYDKLGGSQAFADAVENYRLLPRGLINAFAIVLPWMQFVTGWCLVLGVLAPGAALVSAALYLSFTAALVSALVRGLNIDCGCFGVSGEGGRIAWVSVGPRLLGVAASLQVMLASYTFEWPASLMVRRPRSEEQY